VRRCHQHAVRMSARERIRWQEQAQGVAAVTLQSLDPQNGGPVAQ
jgi:hypothetical protein